jgi:hypothetical protein
MVVRLGIGVFWLGCFLSVIGLVMFLPPFVSQTRVYGFNLESFLETIFMAAIPLVLGIVTRFVLAGR